MLSVEDIQKKLMYFCAVVFIFGSIIFGVREQNHFFGLNESSDMIDCIFYSSITFSGSGYAEIYPQTSIAKIIILVLSIIKILIIVLPLEKLEGEFFEVANTKITLEDINDIVENLDRINN